jgi:DNA-binding MarR family transcriptional regulator
MLMTTGIETTTGPTTLRLYLTGARLRSRKAEGRTMDGSHWAQLAQALSLGSRALRKRITRLTRPHQLTDTEFLFLCCCLREGVPIPQGQVGDSLGLSPAQVSGIAEKLRAAGLVTVERGTSDRRKQFCILTARGEQLERHLAEKLRVDSSQCGIGFSDVDLNHLLSLLDKLVAFEQTGPDQADMEAA